MKATLYTLFSILVISSQLLCAESINGDSIYEGKTLDLWFSDIAPVVPDSHPKKEILIKSGKAEGIFQEIGPDVIPYLLGYITNETSSKNTSRAYYVFSGLGKSAAPAIPELTERFLRKKDPVYSAGRALGLIGSKEVIDPLLEGLEHPNRSIRTGALVALGMMSKNKIEAQIPAIIKATKDEDHRVRHEAVIALGHIKRRIDISIPALIECLKDPDPYVWKQTIRALREFGGEAQAATPALLTIYEKHSEDFSITFGIKSTLKKTDPQAAKRL